MEAGRGSPHGGVYLSFEHRSEAELRSAFGPVIDRLAGNGIDLTKMPVEVAPIAHYHMGGIVADVTMATEAPGLFAAGEAVGGANGANRLSGNAITEALVFGRQAGRSAAARANELQAAAPVNGSARAIIDLFAMDGDGDINTAGMIQKLQATMADDVRPFRLDAAGSPARCRLSTSCSRSALGEHPAGSRGAFDMQRLDWLDLRNMLPVARSVAQAALARTESRGAHQREDHAVTREKWQVNQVVRWRNGELSLARIRAQRRRCRHDGRSHPQSLARHRCVCRPMGNLHGAVRPGAIRLDGLRSIRVRHDPSLAFRFSCINANACKECMMRIDGETAHASTARLEPREMSVAPLPTRRSCATLVPDRPAVERIES